MRSKSTKDLKSLAPFTGNVAATACPVRVARVFCLMPLIDKPLPELFQYRGTNPRPADFDAYWATALKELDATEPRPELCSSNAIAPRHAECFDLWFTGVGGARVYAKY